MVVENQVGQEIRRTAEQQVEVYTADDYIKIGEVADKKTAEELRRKKEYLEKTGEGNELNPYETHTLNDILLLNSGPEKIRRKSILEATEFAGMVTYEKIKALTSDGGLSTGQSYVSKDFGGLGKENDERLVRLEEIAKQLKGYNEVKATEKDARIRISLENERTQLEELTRAFAAVNPAGNEVFSLGVHSRAEFARLQAPLKNPHDYVDYFMNARDGEINRAQQFGRSEEQLSEIKLSFSLQAKGFIEAAVADGNSEAARKLSEALGWDESYIKGLEDKRAAELALEDRETARLENARQTQESIVKTRAELKNMLSGNQNNEGPV